MLTKKEYIFIISVSLILLAIFSYFLYEKIDYYYILILTLVCEVVLKSIYDIKYKTGDISIHSFGKKNNQRLRYISLIVSLFFLAVVIYIIYGKLWDIKNRG